MERNTDLYLEKFKQADEAFQDIMSSSETAAVISDIRSQYNLSDDATKDLSYIVGTVLLGMTHPKEFIATLETGLNVDRNTAIELAKRINEDIFSPIKKELVAIHNISAANKVAEPAADKPHGETEEEVTPEPEPKKEIHNKPLPTPPAPPKAPTPNKKKDADGADPYREPII